MTEHRITRSGERCSDWLQKKVTKGRGQAYREQRYNGRSFLRVETGKNQNH